MRGVWSGDTRSITTTSRATGYTTSKDVLAGCRQEINAEHNRKLEAAREQRQNRRQPAA
jgi:hypothetical protein